MMRKENNKKLKDPSFLKYPSLYEIIMLGIVISSLFVSYSALRESEKSNLLTNKVVQLMTEEQSPEVIHRETICPDFFEPYSSKTIELKNLGNLPTTYSLNFIIIDGFFCSKSDMISFLEEDWKGSSYDDFMKRYSSIISHRWQENCSYQGIIEGRGKLELIFSILTDQNVEANPEFKIDYSFEKLDGSLETKEILDCKYQTKMIKNGKSDFLWYALI